jgi:hypothetical protein
VGDLIDEVAEIVLAFRPAGRRRLTQSEPAAWALATEIVEYIWNRDAE